MTDLKWLPDNVSSDHSGASRAVLKLNGFAPVPTYIDIRRFTRRVMT